ncbi:hypothetical protein RA086_02335 [Lactiplantibacillus sp. WILCCON 0030]|uniref:Uncharacterized protein n=1 Tax=Lactiplantibacillus brownii TaxID=3069269 RepID=A0ABU1A7R9_9LACO|nr:hypothetical protein [Lactiplantibacillus brownii]MDQ7936483.1 hypothetical protein [Lactiplantibacillus brownii]
MKTKKGDKVVNLEWFAAECRAGQWFDDHDFKCEQAKIGNKGWDLLVNDSITVNVKYASGQKNNHDNLEFFFHYLHQICNTDYFLIVFAHNFDSNKMERYLIPVGQVADTTVLHFNRYDIPDWLKRFKLTKQECLLLFDIKPTGLSL